MAKVDNEELMEQLQRVAVLSRRGRRAQQKKRDISGSERTIKEDSKRGHRASRNAVAFGDIDAAHHYGNHKVHGGSGRHGQNRILAVLTLQEGISQKDLAYVLGIRPQSLGEALGKLEESGLVRREQNEADHRAVKVYLTDAGKGRAAKVAEDRKKTAADVFSVLTEEEKSQLTSIITKLTDSLEQQLAPKESDSKDSGCNCSE
jgi:DNA-binding MarR family transcriptional regulator